MTRTVIGPPPSFPATTGIQPSFSIPRAGVSRQWNLVTDIVARRSDNGSLPADPAFAHRLVPLVLDATRICRRGSPRGRGADVARGRRALARAAASPQ